ncbi:hypothetical protein C8R46DRAFT_1284016 [Mycena filopes]|nr:hypothetical protein C8R46DRAFT_1284016 [Mycena filopes]
MYSAGAHEETDYSQLCLNPYPLVDPSRRGKVVGNFRLCFDKASGALESRMDTKLPNLRFSYGLSSRIAVEVLEFVRKLWVFGPKKVRTVLVDAKLNAVIACIRAGLTTAYCNAPGTRAVQRVRKPKEGMDYGRRDMPIPTQMNVVWGVEAAASAPLSRYCEEGALTSSSNPMGAPMSIAPSVMGILGIWSTSWRYLSESTILRERDRRTDSAEFKVLESDAAPLPNAMDIGWSETQKLDLERP